MVHPFLNPSSNAARPVVLASSEPYARLCKVACSEGVAASHLAMPPQSWNLARFIRGCSGHYTVSSAAWQECALSGCLWCRFLAYHFLEVLEQWPDWPFPTIDVRVGCTVSVDEESVRTMFVLLEFAQKASYASFMLYAAADDPAATYIKARTRIPHVGAAPVLAMAKACIEECARDHTACRAVTLESPPLPKRLIDCSDPLHVRIVETGRHTCGQYIALSYVWGGNQPHRTSTSNLASYVKDGIDPAFLPQTIRDAIHVTHVLGVRFLWIDSLCIIQDSQEDKHRELASMRNVYRYAYLTIDASNAARATEGFLQDRSPLDPDAILPFLCPPDPEKALDGERVGKVYLANCSTPKRYRENGYKWYHNNQDICTDTTQSQGSQTRQRGWCLQEALLSTRSLVFTDLTLQLRCQTITQNVGGASHIDFSASELPRLPDDILRPNWLTDSTVVGQQRELIHRRWLRIVEDYSGRSLSEPGDKLVACAAIAEMFAPALGPDYIAGLWCDFLFRDLLWSRAYRYRRSHTQRPRDYHHAPSWSWASTGFPVTYESSQGRVLDSELAAEVVAYTIIRQNEALRFGSVHAGGSLSLRAVLLKLGCMPVDDVGNLGPWRLRRAIQLDEVAALSDAALSPLPEPSVRSIIEFDIEPDYEDDRHVRDLWALLLTIHTNRILQCLAVTRVDWSTRQSAGLDGQQEEVYRRVGMCRTASSIGKEDMREMCQSAQKVEIVLV